MIFFGCWPPMAKRTCIKSGFHDVHALFYIVVHSVHARYLIKCLLDIFSLVWTLVSTKLQGFSCFLTRNMFDSLVVYLTHLIPHVHFQCFSHALHIATSCTQPPLAHTFATLVMHWSIPGFFILAYHIYLILCSILFCLLFELHFSFILHPSCIILFVHTFISSPFFSLTPLSICVKKGESILQSSIPESFVIST